MQTGAEEVGGQRAPLLASRPPPCRPALVPAQRYAPVSLDLSPLWQHPNPLGRRASEAEVIAAFALLQLPPASTANRMGV